jgi:hypothetical protein
VIEIGRRLTECQKILGHGNWLPWLDRELGWSQSAALNFMRAFQLGKSKSTNFADLNLAISALYLLAAPNTPAGARDKIIERAGAGETIKVADVRKAIGEARQPKPLMTTNNAAAPKAIARTTHLDVIAAWMAAAPAERTKAIDAIGFRCVLAAFPDAWWPLLEKHAAERRQQQTISSKAPTPAGDDDLTIPEYLRRAHPVDVAGAA